MIKALMIGVPYDIYSGAFPSTMIAMPARRVQLTVQSVLDNGSAIDIDLEGSDDGITFAPLADSNFSDADGEIITINTSAVFIRANGSVTADAFGLLVVAKA